jgi:hypothetical protein
MRPPRTAVLRATSTGWSPQYHLRSGQDFTTSKYHRSKALFSSWAGTWNVKEIYTAICYKCVTWVTLNRPLCVQLRAVIKFF